MTSNAEKPKPGFGIGTAIGITIILGGIGYATAHKPDGHPGPFPTTTHTATHSPSPTAKRVHH